MSSAEIESSITPPPSDSESFASAAERAANAGANVASKATRQVKRQAESTRAGVSSTATSLADETSDVVDDAANALDKSGRETLGRATAAVSDRIRSFSAYLDGCTLEDLLRDAQRLVQRNPAIMIGGGVVVGFALSHFLKASGGRRRGR